MIIKGEKKDETVLKDDASIYSKREKKSEKQKFRELRGKEKWTYFKDYYMKPLIVGIVVLAIAVSVVYSVAIDKPEDILYAAVVDNPFTEDILAEMTAAMEEVLVQDADKQRVSIDASYFLNSESSYYSSMKLMTLVAAREIDVMIMPAAEFQNQVNGGTLAPLNTFFDEETLARWEEHIVNATPADTDIATGEITYGEQDRYGLKLNAYLESKGYDLSRAATTYVMGFVVNTEHPDSCRELAYYVFGKE